MAHGKTTTPFVSCIKIKGIKLLPPLITEKRRIELQQHKQQAIKLERRLKNCRELKKNLQELLNFQSLTDRPQSDITFRDDSHIEALGIMEDDKNTSSSLEKKPLRKISLTKDIIDVTEYSNDGIKMIQSGMYEHCKEPNHDGRRTSVNNHTHASLNMPANSNLSQSRNCKYNWVNTNYHNSDHTSPYSDIKDKVQLRGKNSNLILNDTSGNISPEKSPKPRLIRSNSYTLDSPSPILLAHLEKTNKNGEHKNLEQSQQLSQSRNWSSLENNYIPFENSNFSSINTVYNIEDNIGNKKDTCTTPTSKVTNIDHGNARSVSPMIEVIQTDISVQQITLNANDNQSINVSNNICDISDPNSQLMQILRNVPDNYSKQIIELIKSQELEKFKIHSPRKNVNLNSNSKENEPDTQVIIEKPATHITKKSDSKNGNYHPKDFESENQAYIPSNSNSAQHSQREYDQNSMHDSISFEDSIIVSPSQSVHYSITSSDTLRNLSSPSIKLIDLESRDKTEEKCQPDRYKDILNFYVQEQINQNINVSRELFPQMDPASVQTIKQEWAASVIGAYVKGYLTRRLLKTERVQGLIDTIKDALICALQLHSADNVDESDVELHRRLINQVSAACYAFHDIFFNLSIQEKMSMISTDRQRKIEKAKRPASAPASRRSTSTSSQSSSKQRFQTHSQSLTKV